MVEEQIVGIIPSVHGGMFGQKAYNIIVLNNGLIIAQLTKKMMNEEIKKVSESSKEQGDGILKRMASTMTAGYKIHEKYFTMTAEQIRNETEGNVFITNESVKKIRIRMGHIHEDGRNQPNEIKIVWDTGKQKYTFNQINAKQAKDLLQQTLGTKVK